MKRRELLELVLLAVIAVAGCVTAAVAIKVAREGLQMEISMEEASEIEAAYLQAVEDMEGE